MRWWQVAVLSRLNTALLAHFETFVDVTNIHGLQLELFTTCSALLVIIYRLLVAIASDKTACVHV